MPAGRLTLFAGRRLPRLAGCLVAAAAVAGIFAACNGGGVSATLSPTGGAASPGASAGPSGLAATPQIIANKGPSNWDRGPYTLAGGNYRLDWTSDGGCTELYFGIAGASGNSYAEAPSAGEIDPKDMNAGSRTISNVPAGRYYFNASGIACKTYAATLTQVP